MKKTIILITAVLILFPLGVLVYKARVLKLSLIPQMVDDVWNLHINIKPKRDVTSFSFPIPKMGLGQKVSDERIRRKDLEVFIDSNSDSHVATWTSKDVEILKVNISPWEPMIVPNRCIRFFHTNAGKHERTGYWFMVTS